MREFLTDMGRIPLLTPAEEITLGNQVQAAMALQQLPAEQLTAADRRTVRVGMRARARMVQANIRLVVTVSRRHMNRGVDQLDLIQEGILGLIRGVEKFDPTRGYKFSTYAFWWIRQAMTRALDDRSRVIRSPVHICDLQRRIRAIARLTLQGHGRAPTMAELVEGTGRTEEQVAAAIAADLPIASLAMRCGEDGSELGEILSSSELSPDDVLDQDDRADQMAAIVAQGLARMTPQQREVIARRFGLAGGQQETLHAIAADMGITRERVRQIEAKALGIIKAHAAGGLEVLRG